MTEDIKPTWMSDRQEPQYPVDTETTVTTHPDPPAREWPDAGMAYVVANLAKTNPGSLEPNWEPKEYTDSYENVHYVPMNSCAYGTFQFPGNYLSTGNLNGCTAVAAAYRDKQDTVHSFLGHYDSENVREVDQNGKLKLSELLAEFTGQQPVRVAVAYSKSHNPPHTNGEAYDPEDFPVDAIIKDCRALPTGSSVLLIPYETSSDRNNPTIGHMLHIGRGGSDLINFGWNGHAVEVGESEQSDDRRRRAAQALTSALDDEEWDLDF